MNNRIAVTNVSSCSASSPLLLRGEPVPALRKAAELGYDAMEIHVVEPDGFPAAALHEVCEKYGVKISAIVTGRIFTMRHLCLTSADTRKRAAAMREVRQYIDIAAELGATDGVVIAWVKGTRPDSDGGDFDRLLARQLTELGGYAEAKGQRILLEVMNRYETNVFNTAQETLDFIQKWKLPNCWIHLDTFHMNIEETDMSRAILTAGSKLGYFHIADSNRLYPGAGHLDFAPIFQALRQINYSGTLSLECIPFPDSNTAAAKGIMNVAKYARNS